MEEFLVHASKTQMMHTIQYYFHVREECIVASACELLLQTVVLLWHFYISFIKIKTLGSELRYNFCNISQIHLHIVITKSLSEYLKGTFEHLKGNDKKYFYLTQEYQSDRIWSHALSYWESKASQPFPYTFKLLFYLYILEEQSTEF